MCRVRERAISRSRSISRVHFDFEITLNSKTIGTEEKNKYQNKIGEKNLLRIQGKKNEAENPEKERKEKQAKLIKKVKIPSQDI